MTARFALADYAAVLRRLLPRGRVWSEDPGSVQGAVITGLAGGFERSDAAAVALLVDVFPATTDALLPEWEASLGLPDPCAGPEATAPQRRAQVVARLVAGGGLSASRYITFAAELGFTIEIETYAPFRVGVNRVTQRLFSRAWAHAWGVRVLANTSGLSSAVLLCELEAIRPAETTVFLLP
jgi:uncharacterized protein YmfQ (DUF2313 family)